MIERLLDVLAPRRKPDGDAGYRRLLRWLALPVTDRRWAAPLAAVALGFGIFAGVAIGPGATGTLATAPYQLIEMPSSGGGASGGEEEETAAADPAPEANGEAFAGGEEESAAFTPIVPVEEESTEAAGGEERPQAAPKGEKEPEQPEKQELAGTVIHVNPAAGSYTVAETGGVMTAVHAGKLPAPGSQVEVPIRALANGTLAEAGKRHRTAPVPAAAAELAGIVTFVSADPAAPAYTVSNRGSSVLVHVAADPSGAVPPLPALGAYGIVKVAIEAGALSQRQFSGGGAPFAHAELAGIVAAVNAETAQLTISADDIRESGEDITLAIPAQIDASALVAGDSVLASADIAADGGLSLTGLASDERLEGADDATATQGDLVPEKSKGEG